MGVFIAMLRGVNVGGRRIKMDALRKLCPALRLRDACTHLQSGNLVFRADGEGAAIARRLETAIEREFGFHSDVIVRTTEEIREVISRSPFGARGLEPSKILVYFLAGEPSAEARTKISRMETSPEELHMHAREVFIYFPNGMARPKLSMAAVDRALQVPGTGRNWNTAVKLLEIAESLSAR